MRKLRELKKIEEEERKLLSYFQEERINYNWIIAKNNLKIGRVSSSTNRDKLKIYPKIIL